MPCPLTSCCPHSWHVTIAITIQALNSVSFTHIYTLQAVIVRCPTPHLCAHFSFCQFRRDGGDDALYALATVRAALEYIRRSGPNLPL